MRLGAFPFCHYPVNEALPQYLYPLFTWIQLLALFSRIKTENSGSENCAMPGEKFWPEFKVLSNSDWIVLTKSNWTERSTEVFSILFLFRSTRQNQSKYCSAGYIACNCSMFKRLILSHIQFDKMLFVHKHAMKSLQFFKDFFPFKISAMSFLAALATF